MPREEDRSSECVDDVRGLWKRTVYRRVDGVIDTSAEVFWLQGPHFFVDIRQPIERRSFVGVGCLRDLDDGHLSWLALQNAFAGTLELDGAAAWWHRTIDMQPTGPLQDRARLQQTGEVLEEFGTESPYYERWQRQGASTGPCWGLQLQGTVDGRSGFLVRVADRMMFARARNSALPPGRTLTEALEAAATLEAKQDLIDFEVSLGRVAASDREWLIERSTLPFKAEMPCSIRRRADAAGSGAYVIEMDDLDPKGRRIVSSWRIIDADSRDAGVEID